MGHKSCSLLSKDYAFDDIVDDKILGTYGKELMSIGLHFRDGASNVAGMLVFDASDPGQTLPRIVVVLVIGAHPNR